MNATSYLYQLIINRQPWIVRLDGPRTHQENQLIYDVFFKWFLIVIVKNVTNDLQHN